MPFYVERGVGLTEGQKEFITRIHDFGVGWDEFSERVVRPIMAL